MAVQVFWAKIENFPNYSCSDDGHIVNDETGKLLRQSMTIQGAVKVNLFKDGEWYTRSVKVLVAKAFVKIPMDDEVVFNTPIHLDGDQMNNRADNLLWRPRWFAYQYTQQFHDSEVRSWRGRVEDLESGVSYRNVFEAAIANGLLAKDVLSSIIFKKRVFPTWQRFGYVKLV